MKKFLLAATVLGAMVYGGAASAQDFQAGSILVRGGVIGLIPENNGSSTSIGGHVGTTNAVMPELDVDYFLTPSISIEAIASSTEHTVTALAVPTLNLGNQKVGTVWALPPVISAVYHFNTGSGISPYLGAGVNITWFYASQAQNALFSKWSLGNTMGPVLQAGVDVSLGGPWVLNADVKQVFASTKAKIDLSAAGIKASGLHEITAKTNLDPVVLRLAVGYKF